MSLNTALFLKHCREFFLRVTSSMHGSINVIMINFWKKKRFVIKSWRNQKHAGKMIKCTLFDLYGSLNLNCVVLIPSLWSVFVSFFQFNHFIFQTSKSQYCSVYTVRTPSIDEIINLSWVTPFATKTLWKFVYLRFELFYTLVIKVYLAAWSDFHLHW